MSKSSYRKRQSYFDRYLQDIFPSVASGCFVYDADLKFSNWNATRTELMALSAAMHRLAEEALPFERLEVTAALALEMFKDNQYKVKQIPSIASSSKNG